MKNKTIKFKIKTFDIFNYLILSLIIILCMYPFLYIFVYSISDPKLAEKGIYFLPKGFTFDNYIRILSLKNMVNSAFISVSRTFLGTGITVFCCTLLAFLMTKKEMYFRTFLYRMLIVTLYLSSGLIPWYITMKMYNLNNNFLLYVLPSAVSAFYVILIKTFMEQLPAAMEESAKIDGASYFKIFTSIIFPLSMPIIATIAVFSAVNQWNSWTDNYFLVSSPKLSTLQLILYNYLKETNRIASASVADLNRGLAKQAITPAAVRMTITMVVTLPIIFVYPFMQRYFMKGLMLGAIKG